MRTPIDSTIVQQKIKKMGVPGLEPPQISVESEIKALKNGVGSKYPLLMVFQN